MNAHARRWLATAAIAAATLTLAACDGNGEDPATTPPTETTTEPSDDVTTADPTPTATPPEVEEPTAPPEMQVDDTVGASAAVWYYLKLYDYMRATGETAVWESMSSPECEWCTTVLDETRSLHQDGGWVETLGLDFDIASSRVRLPDAESDFYTVILPVTEPSFVIVHGDGTTTENDGYTLDPMAIGIRYENGRFVVVGVNYELG